MAGRDAVGGESAEEFAEEVVDVDLGDEIAGGAGELGREIVLALLEFAAGVREAEAVVLGMSGEAAAASIGELKLAKVENVGKSRVGHGDSIALYILYSIYTLRSDARFCASFRMIMETWGRELTADSSRLEGSEQGAAGGGKKNQQPDGILNAEQAKVKQRQVLHPAAKEEKSDCGESDRQKSDGSRHVDELSSQLRARKRIHGLS